ncbi:MAG TPA: DNA-directed RNA polymerase subunit alpha [Bacteroidia bacterium]|nr:DNA-directed RNA polymerase subunit alpha [Bacteroidia bacterium]
MAILNFIKPDKVILIKSTDTVGQFEFRPLEPGFGITIGNSIRRILLSSLEGNAITSVRIEGVPHEFSTIKGVVEDVTEIVLNLKKVRFKQQIKGENFEKVMVNFSGSNKFTAGDLNKFLSSFEVLNPDLVIFNCEPNVKLRMEFTIERGRGYVPAEENKKEDVPEGTIFIDAIYTPIKHVKYSIENYRIEQKTDYEKLNIEIVTDGSIHPKEALTEAAKILIQHFLLFSDEKMTFEEELKKESNVSDEKDAQMRQLLKTKLVDLDLSVRALNCLKSADVETLGELVSFNKNDLLKFRNFGKKSLAELEELLQSKGLQFGMNVSKYLDKK